jgi:uncharacterized protein
VIRIAVRRLLLVSSLLLGSVDSGRADQALPIPSSLLPALSGRLVDGARILDDTTKAEIADKLAAQEAKSGDQVVVVTLPDLRGYPIEAWGLSLGRFWKIGQAGKDNGVLLLIAPSERKVRIEVGYGLEDKLTDAAADKIIRSTIIPRFKIGDFPGGIADGIDAIFAMLDGTYQPKAESSIDLGAFGKWAESFALAVLSLLTLLILNLRSRRDLITGKRHWYWMSYGADGFAAPTGRHSGGFLGGSGGGSFGGGGGGFGGGGASGGW